MAREHGEPKRIRMYVDDVADVALWSDRGADDDLVDRLSITTDLRQRVRIWVGEYTASIVDPDTQWTMQDLIDHDLRGYRLSRELQQAVGPAYRVEYGFHTEEGRNSVQGM